AGILGVDIAADAAHRNLLQRGLHGGSERRHDLLAFLDEEQRGAARRARPEPGQAGEQLDQALDLGAGGGSGHGTEPLVLSYCMPFDGACARTAWISWRRLNKARLSSIPGVISAIAASR